MNRIETRDDRDELLDESATLWRITAAPVIWAGHFLLCYGGAAIWCAKLGGGIGGLRLSILGLTLAALAAIAWNGWRGLRASEGVAPPELSRPEHRHRFLGRAAFLLSVISAVGVAYVALPALFIASCR
ncbi:hypothetical protein [Frigidibacter sp. MR17.24]|uniref:hypothetical protein n=1 Tax=Frigidibacter sp. MR17.24 TaxID=3127345 RepID=UPI003012DF0A